MIDQEKQAATLADINTEMIKQLQSIGFDTLNIGYAMMGAATALIHNVEGYDGVKKVLNLSLATIEYDNENRKKQFQ
jgi:hypothetical protein